MRPWLPATRSTTPPTRPVHFRKRERPVYQPSPATFPLKGEGDAGQRRRPASQLLPPDDVALAGYAAALERAPLAAASRTK